MPYHIKDLTKSNQESKVVSYCGEPIVGTHFADITSAIGNIMSASIETTVCPDCAKAIQTILNSTN